MKITKSDLVIIGLLLLISMMYMTNRDSGAKRLYLISENGKTNIPLKSEMMKLHGGEVLIEVTEEGARFIKSDCPNELCVKSGWVRKCGETAVCVPNRLALVMECDGELYDAVSE